MFCDCCNTMKNGRMISEASVGVDRISELPDEVVCHILSFLPSKEAIATCVLSTRWRSLWTMVPVLDFEWRESPTFPESESILLLSNFSFMVNKFLSLRTTPRITRFRLKCESQPCHPHHFKAWVSAAVAGQVEDLKFSLNGPDLMSQWPISLFTCTTLVTLKLKGRFDLNVPWSVTVHLPSLKTLHLKADEALHCDSLARLLSGCSVVEEVYLEMWKCCVLNIRSRDVFQAFIRCPQTLMSSIQLKRLGAWMHQFLLAEFLSAVDGVNFTST